MSLIKNKNKNKKINSLTDWQYLLPFGKTHSSIIKETPLCTSVTQASFTVEAAVVLPVLICCMTAVLFFFRVMQVQLDVERALHKTAGNMAVCMHYQEMPGQAVCLAEAKTILSVNLADSQAVRTFVNGGILGVGLAQSEFSMQQTELVASYQVRLPFDLFGRKQVKLQQRVVCNNWTGYQQQTVQEQLVYITETGTVYHLTRECSYLDLSIRTAREDQINQLRNANRKKYKKCRICGDLQTEHHTIYITDYGDSYHKKLECSGLKRTVYAVPLSEVEGRPACSKCGT